MAFDAREWVLGHPARSALFALQVPTIERIKMVRGEMKRTILRHKSFYAGEITFDEEVKECGGDGRWTVQGNWDKAGRTLFKDFSRRLPDLELKELQRGNLDYERRGI